MSRNGASLSAYRVTLGGNECVWLHYVCLLAQRLYLCGFLCNPSGTLDTVCSLKFTPCALVCMHDRPCVFVCLCSSEEHLPPLWCERLTHFLLRRCPLFSMSGGAEKYCTWPVHLSIPWVLQYWLCTAVHTAARWLFKYCHCFLQPSLQAVFMLSLFGSEMQDIIRGYVWRLNTHELSHPLVLSS